MTEMRRWRRWGWSLAGLIAGLTGPLGCHDAKRVQPVSILNPEFGSMTIAVAPAVNLSGSADFDRNRFADLMASELGYTEGISVIPVSRVLGLLATQGKDRVESPSHALELVELLGADAILVFAVTEYDPYDPPSIGIAAQLYGTRPRARGRAFDPVVLSRQTRLTGANPGPSAQPLLAQAERVFNAAHESVALEIQRFARRRGADDSPYGWRKYVVSQQHYIRFCCHATITELISGDIEVQSAARRDDR